MAMYAIKTNKLHRPGMAKSICRGAIATLILTVGTTAVAQESIRVQHGTVSGTGAIRTCTSGQNNSGGTIENRPCISNTSINEAIDARIQAAGAATPGPNSVGSGEIIDGSVTGDDIADGTVTGTDIADGTITGVDVQDGSLTGVDIQDGSITQADLSNDSVGSAQIIDGSVTGADIAAETITGANVQDGSLTGADIQDGSITQADLGNDSVGSAQIIDQSVTQADLADNSVGSAQIIDNSVTGADIQDGGVENVDLADDSVNSRTIQNDSILLEDLNSEVTSYINSGNADTLKQANAYTDQRFNELQGEVARNAEIANDGVAMALAAKVPSLADGANGAFAIGLGHYSGSTALAAGGTAWIPGSNAQMFGTVGYGFKAKKFGASIGVMFSF